jgi:L-lactate dehydrogenase complex protein LldG
MAAREEILTAVRQHPPPSQDLPQVPAFPGAGDRLVDEFVAALELIEGDCVVQPPSDLQSWLSERFPEAKRICSAVAELEGTVTPEDFADWNEPADVDVTVVRSPLGVAETGSILVTERELRVNTIATLAQHLVVLLDPADLVPTIHQAYAHPSFQNAAYAVLLSGPSGTADIGGVPVHPAQGATTLTVILTPPTDGGQGGTEAPGGSTNAGDP